MRFLLDSNCWMQIVRARENVEQVRELLATVPNDDILVTDLTVHSLAIVMGRFGMLVDFPKFLKLSGIGDAIQIVEIDHVDLDRVIHAAQLYRLDFEDAYQYVAAEMNGLKLVSFDRHFSRTPNGCVTPVAALHLFIDEQQKPQPEA